MILVVQTGTSSKHSSLVRHLAAGLGDVLQRSPQCPQARSRRTQHRLPPEQAAALVAEYQAGCGVKDLAERWRVHRGTVANHLREAGVEPRRRGLDPEQVTEAVRLYNQGWSLRQLAVRYGYDYQTVRQALLRAGVVFRPPNGQQP